MQFGGRIAYGIQEDTVNETVYESSLISAAVPEGWMAFPGADFFRNYPDEPGDPHVIRIHKGAVDEWDQFTTPGLQINYTESGSTMTVLKNIYQDVKDLEPVAIGDAVWQGFSAVSAGVPLTVLWITEPHQIQLFIWPQMEKGSVSLEDADVQKIIGSIKIK